MRIIDANVLVNEFLNVCRTEFEVKNKCMTDENVLHLIQNAPTVLHDNYSMGYQDGVKKVLSERPQGEWLHPYKSDIARECSNCHRQMPITNYYHFCPNCGVKMKKEAENE